MKTTALVFIVLVLLAVGYVVYRGSGGPDSPENVAAPAAGEAADVAPGVTPTPQDAGRREVVEETAPPAASGTGSIDVLVVHAETGAPVPSAVVHFLDGDAFRKELERTGAAPPKSMEAAMEEFGRRFTADDLGRLTVPEVARPMLLGTAPGLYGTTGGGARGKRVLRLVLRPDWDVVVRVVNRAGAPLAGIPVAILVGDRGWAALPVDSRSPDGIVEFPHAASLTRGSEATVLRVSLALPLLQSVEATIDPQAPPTAPIELVAPELGKLDVRVVDRDGKAYDEAVFVNVLAFDEKAVADPRRRWKGPFEEAGIRGTLEPGMPSLVLQVGLGMDLEVRAGSSSGIGPVSERMAGPSRPDQVVPVTVSLFTPDPAIVGRLVDEEGNTLGPGRFEFSVHTTRGDGRRGMSGTTLRTDEEGRFRHPIPDPHRPGTVRTIAIAPRRQSDDAPTEARVDLSFRLRPGDTDLGDLVLERLPVFLSGVVVDAAGTPVAGARATVLKEARTNVGGAESVRWEPTLDLGATTDEEGRFTIHGRIDSASTAVQASHQAHVSSEIVPFPPGSTNVTVALIAGGSITGRILFDDGGPPGVQISIVREDEPDARPSSQAPTPDGQFLLTRLSPAPYTVRLFLRGYGEPLFEAAGVEVRGGEVTEDPRLATIDLRGQIHRFTVTVVDADGEPVENASARFQSPTAPEERPGRARSGKDGTLRIETVFDAVDVDVSARGYRNEHLPTVSADERVVLRHGLPLRVVLGNRNGLPEHGIRLEASFRQGGGYGYSADTAARFDAEGIARYLAPEPGVYGVSFFVREDVGPDGGLGSIPHLADPITIEVADTPTEQAFPIDVPPEVVQVAKDLLGEVP